MRKQWKLRIAALAALALAALLCGCAQRAGKAPESDPPEVHTLTVDLPESEEAPMALRLAGQAKHPALMSCLYGGRFYPERTVTRGEFCRMLAPMLKGLPEGTASFSDLDPGSAGYEEAAALTDAGILLTEDDGLFRAKEDLTRRELTMTLLRLSRSLPGSAGKRADALAAEVSSGASSRVGTTEDLDEPILREELAYVLVRLAGREPCEAGLFLGGHLPEDVALDDFAWTYIADAVTDGVVETPAEGVYRANGWLYASWADGTLIRDMDWGVWTFGIDGRYTTGDEELDGYLQQGLIDSGAAELTGTKALQAAYLYVKEYGEYLVRPEDATPLAPAATGWEYDRALRFFVYGGGTCYGYAAAFGLLARALGENAYIISGQVNQYHGAHSFVVIPENGVDWIYDPELEDTRPARHADLALFRIRNYGIYDYWYTPDWD